MSHSPRKFRQEEIVPFRANRDCKIVNLGSLENPFVVLLLMNCKNDNEELISSSVPHAIQENGTFLIDLDKLANRKDVFADDNGVWTIKGSRSKSYSVEKDADGQVVSLNKSQENSGGVRVYFDWCISRGLEKYIFGTIYVPIHDVPT